MTIRKNLQILLTIAICAWATTAYPAETNLSIQKVSPDASRRELWEGKSGPIAHGGKFYLSYQGNCEPAQNGQPVDIYAKSVDRATNKWEQGIIGKTICGGPHNYGGGRLMRFPDTHPNVALRGRFIAFFRPHSSVDPQTCTGSTPYCIRFAISLRPNDITEWGSPQLVKTANNATLEQGWPLGGMGDFTKDGTFHAFGQGSGTLQYTRMKPDLTFETFGIVRGENQSNVNSPGCGPNAKVYPDGVMDILWAPGNCSGAAGPLYYARSVDGGNSWHSANKAASFTSSGGLLKSGTAAPFGTYPLAFRVRSGTYAANVAMNRLANGTPILAETPAAASYKPTIWKWSGAGWDRYTFNTPNVHTHTSINLDVIDDNLIIVTLAAGNRVYEYVVRAGGTKWESERLVFAAPSGSTQLTRLNTETVQEAGVARVVGKFAVAWGTIQSSDSTGRHEVYAMDRPVSCIVGKIDCPVVLPDPVVEPPPPVDPVDPVKPPLRYNMVGECLLPADKSEGVCTFSIKGVVP